MYLTKDKLNRNEAVNIFILLSIKNLYTHYYFIFLINLNQTNSKQVEQHQR